MRLLVCCVPYDSGKSGVSVYIRNVVQELAGAGHDLTLVVEPDEQETFSGYRQMVLPGFCRRAFLSMLYCLLILPWCIRRGAYDRVLVCAGNRRMLMFCRCETWVVIHDLSQYHVPVKYDLWRMLYIKEILPHYVRRVARVVVAVSQSTANDLQRFWKIPAGRIMVNYNGYEAARLPLRGNDSSGRCVLYVSRIEVPGKNHLNLLQAWERLPETSVRDYKLVIAGADWSGAEQVHAYASGMARRDSVVFTGFMTREALNHWYRCCTLYIFPSLFEGFGLSLIEAMACGAVCACSNNSSLGEIAGDAALTFDPHDPDAIAAAMVRGLEDEALRRELREKGYRRVTEFDWGRHARRLAGEWQPRLEIFGVPIFTGRMDQAMAQLRQMLAEPELSCRFCAFVNADCLNQAYVNPTYRQWLARAEVIWADGVGVALVGRHQGTPVQDNVNGTDMLPLLCQAGFRLFLLGAQPGVAAKAAERLRQLYPESRIVGTEHGYFSGREEEVLEAIQTAGTEILLVGMGVPRQEGWIVEHLPRLRCRVAIGVGGLFDFASGRIARAPRWMRRCRLEWLYRLWQEPRRLFRRYVLGNPLFLYRLYFGQRGRHF